MPLEELQSIFEKFVQSSRTKTNAGGTGLGLAICAQIIAAHHGKIWVTSGDRGSDFHFLIPTVPLVSVDQIPD